MPPDVNRIYNVVVVLGLELAAQGCAGSTTSEGDNGASSTTAGGGSTATSNSNSSATTVTSGASATGSVTSGVGGASNTTTTTSSDGIVLPGTSTTSSGTDGSAGAAPGPEDLLCPASQWSCETAACEHPAYGSGFECSCDTERPTSEDDCAADERFVCNQYESEDGVVPFSCLCVPSATDCYNTCSAVNPWDASVPSSITPDCTTRTVFCDCAYPVILK